MEFRIEPGALTDAVARAARVLPTRSPVPVLGGLLLEAADGRLRVSGLDFEASACVEVEAGDRTGGEGAGHGPAAARHLQGAVRRRTGVRARGSWWPGTVPGSASRVLPLDDYPALPPLPEIRGEVDAARFAAAVAQVSVAAGRDDTLPTLTPARS